MNKKEVVKNYLLKNKIEEYFVKNPNKKSVIMTYEGADGRTSWKVTKNKSSFDITEVVASKNKFVLEAGTQILTPPANNDKTNAKGSPQGNLVQQPASRPYYGDESDPEAAARREKAISDTEQYQAWLPTSPVSKFAKTLSATKDMGATLSAMYDDMTKIYGDEQKAIQVFNHYFQGGNVKIASKQDLTNQAVRKSISDFIKAKHPQLPKNFFKEGKTFFVEMPALGAPNPTMSTQGQGETKPTQPGLKSPNVKAAQAQNLQAFNQMDFSGKLSMIQSGAVPINEPVLSSTFLDLMNPNALKDVVQLRKILESVSGNIEPINKGIAGAFLGVLTVLSNHKNVVSADNRKAGNIVKEEDEVQPKLPDASVDSKKKTDDAEDDVGLEDDGNKDTSEDPPQLNKSEEEYILQKRLTGQTIRDANVKLNANGGELTLTLVNTNIPSKIEWKNNGNVSFSFKNRVYTLRRGQKS